MSLQDVITAIEENALPISVAEKYLKLYVADIDWQSHISTLWKNSLNKNQNQDIAKEFMKKAIACAVLLPLVEKTPIPDPPSNLLFWCTGWRQFNDRSWFNDLLEVFKEDVQISNNRNKVIQVGVIDPIDVSPITRQAFNWLYEKFKTSITDISDLTQDQLNDVKTKFSNLVKAYGGAIICSMFMNHKNNIDRVLNWRSGYFFEKQLYKVYSVDQIIKIKTAEFSKTNQKYVKKLGV